MANVLRKSLRVKESGELSMFYISANSDNVFSVTDTKDWTTEKYSAEELVKIAKSGIKIAGVSNSGIQVFTPEVALSGLFKKWVLAARAFPLKIVSASEWNDYWSQGWRLERIQNLKMSELDLSSLPIVAAAGASGMCWDASELRVEIGTLILPDCLSLVGSVVFDHMNIKRIIFNRRLKWIGQCAFFASSIEDMYLPADSEGRLEGTFTGCKNLRRVIVDGGHEIMRNVFVGCHALHEVHLGESLRRIGMDIISVSSKAIKSPVESKWYCWCPELEVSSEFLCENPGDWYFTGSVTIRTVGRYRGYEKLEHKPRLCIHLMPSCEPKLFLTERVLAFLKATCDFEVVLDVWKMNFNGIPKS